MVPLKDQLFNEEFYNALTARLNEVYSPLDQKEFYHHLTSGIESLELMDRLYRVSETLALFLPEDFKKSSEIINKTAVHFPNSFSGMAFCDFVAKNGLNEFDRSMKSLHHLTQYSSAEFAIRYFFKEDFQRTLDQMKKWSFDSNVHVRRLASEGSRPRLPWSFKLQEVIDDPKLTLPILDQLSSDKELYVKKSVGNHLNDISKDHPQIAVQFARKNYDLDENSRWIIKRGLRTLIKKGDQDALSIFGVYPDPSIQVLDFSLSKPSISIGDDLLINLKIKSEDERKLNLVIDFIVHYVKKDTSTTTKVFKWKETELQMGESLTLNKKHYFKELSTRKHYPGIHTIEIQINGKSFGSEDFELKD